MNEIVVDNTDDVNEKFQKCDKSLLQQTEFAALCSFIHHFGSDLGIYLTFPQLEQFLNLDQSANWRNWETLHIKLLNKLKYRARPERWEPVLGRFLINHAQNIASLEEAGERLVTGVGPKSLQTSSSFVARPFSPVYYDLEASVRIKLLLILLESQFDRNQGFKDKVNLRSALDLRFRPLGYDVWGRVYWLLKDSEINLLLYREDNINESFQLICQTTDEMRSVRAHLENACPASTKLSDILTNRDGSTNSDSTQCLASPSVREQFLELSHFAIESTEVVVKPSEGTLMNGDLSDELVPHTLQTCSPSSVVPMDSEKIKNTCTSPLSDVKPEALQSVDNTVSPISTCMKIHPDHATSENGSVKCDSVVGSPSPPPLIKTDHESPNDDEDMKPLDKIKLENTEKFKEEEGLECDTTIKTTKSRKRGQIQNVIESTTTVSVAESTVEVRRSGRMRKPVEFLTMEAPQPKRSRHSVKPQSTTPAAPDNLEGSHVKKHRAKRSRITSSKLSQDASNKKSKGKEENVKKKKRRKKRKRGHGRKKTTSTPWLDHTSSSESDADDDTFERALLEHEQSDDDSSVDLAKTNTALDWLDQPESDFNPDDKLTSESDVDSLTRGRNFARQKRLKHMCATASVEPQICSNSDETCQVCGKSHMPEWILLCDRCDRGHHAMCLCPPLYIIPEGDWFCPRCQHEALLQALAECADQIDAEQKKQTIWRRMQERLNFVNISMTNILANDDEEEDRLAARRRARRNENVMYRDSESSQDDGEMEGDDDERGAQNSLSVSQYTSSDSESRDGFRRRMVPRRRAAKQARIANGSLSGRRGRRTKTRSKWFSDSEDEDSFRSDSSSCSASSPPPAPRTARQRPVQYDLGEAFKQLDEALEDDEKYQEEKRLRRNRKLNRFAADSEGSTMDASPDRSPGSGPPPGRSRGKDLSNILGPEWKDDLDLAPPSRLRTRKRHGVVAILSSSSSETDPDQPKTECNGRRKRSNNDKDEDFQPSGSTEEHSNLSEEEEEEEESLTSDSDSSWMCVARQQRRKTGRSRGRPRYSIGRTRRPKKAMHRRGRPLPRFEQSESDDILENDDRANVVHKSSHHPRSVLTRPRRCVRAVVSYRESDDQEEDKGQNSDVDLDFSAPGRPINRRRLVSSSEDEQERKTKENENNSNENNWSPTPVSKRVKIETNRKRQRVLSSDSEYQPDENHDRDQSVDNDGSSTVSDQHESHDAQIDEITSPDLHLNKSRVFDQTSEPSDADSPIVLRITETSPEPYQVPLAVDSVIPGKQQSVSQLENDASRDEESVEEDAEDLLPRHAYPARSTETKPNTPTVPLPLSPDLFG